MFRIGQGVDIHAFSENRRLVLGGIEIPHHLGLAGHSDADVLTHAVMDALLGAAGLGDIGQHFPPDDMKFKDADSLILLSSVIQKINRNGWEVVNIDATIIAQEPRLAPYLPLMAERISSLAGVHSNCVNIKATTSERLGFSGRKEGIAAMAITLLEAREPQVAG